MLAKRVDALILLDQVDLPGTGVVTDARETSAVEPRFGANPRADRAGRQPARPALIFRRWVSR